MNGSFNIRQAARWAERTGNLYRGTDEHGNPEYTYATYSIDTHEVAKVGSYEDCKKAMQERGVEFIQVALSDVCDEMDCSEGEAGCIPEAGEQREWT